MLPGLTAPVPVPVEGVDQGGRFAHERSSSGPLRRRSGVGGPACCQEPGRNQDGDCDGESGRTLQPEGPAHQPDADRCGRTPTTRFAMILYPSVRGWMSMYWQKNVSSQTLATGTGIFPYGARVVVSVMGP